MKQFNHKSAIVVLASLCWSLGNIGCDRSWREEKFTPPQATVGEGDVPPRRPTPGGTSTTPPPVNPGQTPPQSRDDAGTPNQPGQPSDVDGGDSNADRTDDTGPGETNSSDTREPDSSGEDTGDVEPPDEPKFTKAALLKAAAECAVDQYEAFAQRASALKTAVRAIKNDQTLNEARLAFVDATLAFQRVEVFRVGPAARAMDPGGEDLRDWMYSFPTQNRCQVDRNLVSQVYATDFSSVLFNARGLLTLEYLLFERGTTNACSVGIDINSKGTWAALSQSELNGRRDAYAKAVADDIAARAEQLVTAWSKDGGNFMQQVLKAGDGSTTFATQQAALNAFSHALFYIEKEVKDFKLALPLGMTADCTSANGCPHRAELLYSGLSGPSIAQNLAAFRLLFEGCGENYSGLGFDDWLREAGQGDLADRMVTRLEAAEQSVATLPRLLEDAFYDAPDEARAVYAAVKGVTDLLKTEFVSVLNLELPMTAEGDND